MDNSELYALVEQIVRQITAETDKREELYVVLPRRWCPDFTDIFSNVNRTYKVKAVAPDDFIGSEAEKAITSVGCDSILSRNDAMPGEEKIFTTLIPAPSRDLVIRAALGLCDTYRSQWIGTCMERGLPVFLLGAGKPLSGREPINYLKKIEAYYQDLKSYGIEILDSPEQLIGNAAVNVKSETVQSRMRQIVTEGDISKLEIDGKILLYPGDRITALACDEAARLGISIEWI